MVSFIIPEAVAFYLKDCFYKDCLCDSPLYNHINSTFDMLCCYQESIDDMIPKNQRNTFNKNIIKKLMEILN